MKTIKTLVLTKKVRPPISIRECLKTASVLSAQFVEVACSSSDISRLLSKEKPKIVMIDGEHGKEDRALWESMSKMTQSALRLHLLDHAAQLPESLQITKLIHALKEDSTTVILFIDGPSDTLRAELGKLGASFVWPSLNRLSRFESSFYQTVLGAKTLGTGVAAMAKSLYDSLTK